MINHSPRPEVPLGYWPRVHARLRPAHPWELPAGSGVPDTRMVEYWQREGGGWAGQGVAMLAVIAYHRPLADPDLLGRFLHAFGSPATPADREVIAWYAEGGPLGETATLEGQPWPAWALRLSPQQREQLSPEVRAGYAEPVWWLRELGLELRLCYDLWVALRQGEHESLAMLLGGGVPEGKVLLDLYLVAGRLVRDLGDASEVGTKGAGSVGLTIEPALPHPRLQPLEEQEARLWARRLLARHLSAAEERSSRQWLLPEEALGWHALSEQERTQALLPHVDLAPTRRFEDLSTALWLLLGQLIEHGIVLPLCRGCQRPFWPTRKNQRYCGLRCGDTDRQRRIYRPRKRTQRRKGGPADSGPDA